ncbi:MAG: hypothetical protein AB7P00_08885 [Sandaracinaceae bacterium]
MDAWFAGGRRAGAGHKITALSALALVYLGNHGRISLCNHLICLGNHGRISPA